MNDLEKLIAMQSDELIKMQVLLYSLADTLIESNIITAEELEQKIEEKVKVVNEVVSDKIVETKLNQNDLFNIFKGPMGEA